MSTPAQTVTIHRNASASILPLLGVIFVGLKLTGHIDWSWLWVLLPFWIGPALFLALVVVVLVALLIVAAVYLTWLAVDVYCRRQREKTRRVMRELVEQAS